MVPVNKSVVAEFILSGLSRSVKLQTTIFLIFFVMYVITLSGNFLVMSVVYIDPRLRSPMYFFLSNLSFLDMCYSSVTLPQMLSNVISVTKSITFYQCMSQLFFLHFFGATESFLLTVMAYDRYVAICNPLLYHVVMHHRFCNLLVLATWVGGFMHSFTQEFLTFQLPFCGPNKINHFFCDIHPLAVLACSDTHIIDMFIIANSGLLSLCCFLVLLFSYLGIISNIIKIQSAEGRSKAFSTCTTHIIVVTIMFGPCIFMYLRPPVNYSIDKLVSVLYTVLTPLLNPLIYTLRNQDMKKALRKIVEERLSSKVTILSEHKVHLSYLSKRRNHLDKAMALQSEVQSDTPMFTCQMRSNELANKKQQKIGAQQVSMTGDF